MQQATAEEITFANRVQADPGWYVRECLGHHPWSKQIEIIESVRDNERTAVKSAHGLGKSFIAADVALWFGSAHVDSIVATTAPTFRQVRRVIWSEIRRSYQNARVPLGGQLLDTLLRFDEKWFIVGLSARDPDAFQGLHAPHILVIVDESSGVRREICEAIEGLLSSEGARLLKIGNPTDPTSDFYDEFKNPATRKIFMSAYHSPNVSVEFARERGIEKQAEDPVPGLTTEEWIVDKERRWGKESPIFKARVAGEFPEQATDSLIALSWVERARARWAELSEDGPFDEETRKTKLAELEAGPSELGVDVARYGDDETVIRHRRGSVCRFVARYAREGNMKIAGRVIDALREIGDVIGIKIDDSGCGGGVTDRLRELKDEGQTKVLKNVDIVPVNNGERARDHESFLNVRAENLFGLRDRFENDAVVLVDEEDRATSDDLDAQLTQTKYKINSRGQRQVEEKAEIKKRVRKSPDDCDALVLAFASGEPDPISDFAGAAPVSLERESTWPE